MSATYLLCSSRTLPNIGLASANLTADLLSADIGADKQMDTSPYDGLTYRIIGAAMRVHNKLGPGLKEAFYQRGLSVEMQQAGLSFQAEYAVEVHLDEARVGLLYLDHLVDDEIVVEVKALPHMLTNEEQAQVITYLCATGKKVGLLINFGRKGLEFRRILRPREIARWRDRIARYTWVPREARSANPLEYPLTTNPLTDSTPGARQ
jgi:GxxExxY protein